MARPLPPCACRRSFGTSTDRFYCTHPKLMVKDNIVAAEVCRTCPLSNTVPPDTFLAYPFCDGTERERARLQLVIAHYEEDLSWLDDFSQLDRKIYSKGAAGGEHTLPNVGREAHTYLHHIIENYDTLADVTVFLQGDPSDHVSRLFEKICALDTEVSFQYLGDDILVENGRGIPPQPGLPLTEFYEALFDAPAPTYSSCRAGACFAVSRQCVQLRPVSFYRHALGQVLEHELGAWAIERLWHLIFQAPPQTEGVVTAADAGFFRDLQFFVRSLRAASDTPFCVIDLGLTDDQRLWCMEQSGLILWSAPQLYPPMRVIYDTFWWQAWIKPFYLLHAPFDRLLWIDADCVVLKPLDELFRTVRERPIFVRDGTDVVTENDPRLYDHLPLPKNVTISGINLNSGVVGLCTVRDRDILNAWAWAAQWIAVRPAMQRLSAWADQGLLLWAVHANEAIEFINQSMEWNQPIFDEPELLERTFAQQSTLLNVLRERFPTETIIHFLGPHKLSRQLDVQLGSIFGGM